MSRAGAMFDEEVGFSADDKRADRRAGTSDAAGARRLVGGLEGVLEACAGSYSSESSVSARERLLALLVTTEPLMQMWPLTYLLQGTARAHSPGNKSDVESSTVVVRRWNTAHQTVLSTLQRFHFWQNTAN